MGLNFPGQSVLKQQRRNLLVKQDSLKFADFNLELVDSSGPPIGKYERGSLFYNEFDFKLYTASDNKKALTPNKVWVKFDGDAKEFIGGKDGVLTGGTFATGNYGKAITLNGVDEKVAFPADLNWNLGNSWNLSFWIKIQTMGAGERIYIVERFKDSDEFFLLYIENDELRMKYNDGGVESTNIFTVNNLTPGTWHHCNIFFNGASFFQFRLDGNNENADSGESLNSGFFTTELFEMGRSQEFGDFGDNSFELDDFKVMTNFNGSDWVKNGANIDATNWTSYNGTFVREL